MSLPKTHRLMNPLHGQAGEMRQASTKDYYRWQVARSCVVDHTPCVRTHKVGLIAEPSGCLWLAVAKGSQWVHCSSSKCQETGLTTGIARREMETGTGASN